MAIHRVDARVEFGVGEPPVERWAAVVEYAFGRAGPRHRARGFRPEGARIGDAGVEQLAISTHAPHGTTSARSGSAHRAALRRDLGDHPLAELLQVPDL